MELHQVGGHLCCEMSLDALSETPGISLLVFAEGSSGCASAGNEKQFTGRIVLLD